MTVQKSGPMCEAAVMLRHYVSTLVQNVDLLEVS